MKWYKRDPDAALAGMAELTLEECGAYNLILDLIYSRNGNVPDDELFICRSLRCDRRVWRRIRARLLELGKLRSSDGLLRNLRATYELSSAEVRLSAGEKPLDNNDPKNTTTTTSTSRKEDGGGGDARAREPSNVRSLVSKQAIDLAIAIAAIAGFADSKNWPPGWCGAPMRVQAMLDHGWRSEVMLAAARETMAKKRDGPPGNIAYFEKPFARAHAQQSAPLPVAAQVTNAGNREGSLKGALAKLAATIDEQDRLSESGENYPRLIADGRS